MTANAVQGLFRPEVLKARDGAQLGTIRIGHNPRFTVVALASIAMAGVLVAYAVLGEMTRKARLVGLLVPAGGVLNVAAPQSGTLLDVRVREGDAVEQDRLFAVIGIDRSTAKGDVAALVEQNIEERKRSLHAERRLAETQHRQRQQSADDRIRSIGTELRQAQGELASVRRRLELARRSVERYAELARSGFVAEVQAQQKQEELLDLEARESTVERTLIALRRDAQLVRSEKEANQSALQAQLAQLDRQLAALDQERTENTARRELLVPAPAQGTVASVVVHRGQPVVQGQTIATIVPGDPEQPSSALEAHLFAPSRTAGFIEPGQTVWIRFAAYPYQKFGMGKGAIESVSRTPLAAAELPAGQAQALSSAAQTTEPMYRVTVSLEHQTITTYGISQTLKPGMTLEADVIQDRRRLWEWLLDPVLAGAGLSTALAEHTP